MFNEIPAKDPRFASLIELRDSSQMLFEIPEIRRACYENQVAFNAINGEHCRMHSELGIPLPVREELEGVRRVALLGFNQHRDFKKLLKYKKPSEGRFRHNGLPATSAYEPATFQDGTELGLLAAKRAFNKLGCGLI